jgi:hypothetical protein
MLYGAICATPALFLSNNKLLINKSTCYPSFSNEIIKAGYSYLDESYVVDENCSKNILNNFYKLLEEDLGTL